MRLFNWGSHRVLCALLILFSSCAAARPPLPVPDYRATFADAVRLANAHGALDACADNLDRFEADRRRAFGVVGRSSREDELVAILEFTDVAEIRYGVAAVAGGKAVRGVLRNDPSRRGVPHGLQHLLAELSVEQVRSFRSDERAAYELRDGSCYFVSLRIRGEWHRYGVYMPHWRAAEWASTERKLVSELVPLLEIANRRTQTEAAPQARDSGR